MGNDVWLNGMVYFDVVPETLVSDVVEAFWANGYATDTEGRERIQLYADGKESSYQSQTDGGGSLDDVADDVHGRSPSTTPGGSIDVWYEEDNEIWDDDWHPHPDHSYRVRFDLEDGADHLAPISIDGPDDRFLDPGEQEYDVGTRVEAVVDAFAAIAERVDPWVAFLAMGLSEGRKVPTDHPPDHGLEQLPFVIVFGEEWFEHLGGHEHVLNTPVYETRSLSTGSVLIRTRDKAVVKPPLDDGPPGSPEKHLLETTSAEDRHRFIDPFRELDQGELASDPVMCEAHAPFEWKGMDYNTFPGTPDREDHCHVLCVRRERDKLWEAHNDEFVRRLVAEDGQPIGELPNGVPPDQEFISTAIRSAYEEDPSMDMYRMDSVNEPSLYARLRGLNAVPEGESIWTDREFPVTRER